MNPDEDDFYPPGPSGVGSAESVKDDVPPLSEFVANILVPDVEQRRGWRDYWVKRQAPDKPGRRTGFVP